MADQLASAASTADVDACDGDCGTCGTCDDRLTPEGFRDVKDAVAQGTAHESASAVSNVDLIESVKNVVVQEIGLIDLEQNLDEKGFRKIFQDVAGKVMEVNTTHVRTHALARAHARTHAPTHPRTHAPTHPRTRTRARAHVHARTHAHAARVCMHMHVMCKVMENTQRSKLDAEDLAFIRRRIAFMILELENPEDLESCQSRRFQKMERVVCHVGGGRWAPGYVQGVADEEPSEVQHPYIVKVDKPLNVLVSVPQDNNLTVRAEVCFSDPELTRVCLPQEKPNRLRFTISDRVACAVEDSTGNLSDWAAGTVRVVKHPLEACENKAPPLVPYCVRLDSGSDVFVHRDEHWLIRDLSLQPEGPRQAQDGTRCLERFTKRQREDGAWESIDHSTRRMRVTPAPPAE